MPMDNNEFLDELEKTKEYEEMKAEVEKALLAQWNDLLDSGILFMALKKYEDYQREIIANKMVKKGVNVAMKNLKDYLFTNIFNKVKTLVNSGFQKAMTPYLKWTAERAIQKEIKSIEARKNLDFNLRNKKLLDMIDARVTELAKGLDVTTARRMANKVTEAMKISGISKSEFMDYMRNYGEEMTRGRVELIMLTETNAVSEAMRYEFARRNGSQAKTRFTTGDERVCKVCGPLHAVTVPIDEPFPNVGLDITPAHGRCRCYIKYNREAAFSTDRVKKAENNLLGYTVDSTKYLNGAIQSNVWLGGDGREGSDNIVYDLAQTIKTLRNKGIGEPEHKDIDKYASLLSHYSRDICLDTNKLRAEIEKDASVKATDKLALMGRDDMFLQVLGARITLSNEGYAQLIRSIGSWRKVKLI